MDALAPVLAVVQSAGLSGALGPSDQHHLLWARETQAMSFAFHIPLVCSAGRPGARLQHGPVDGT